jgi:hypothetical protein
MSDEQKIVEDTSVETPKTEETPIEQKAAETPVVETPTVEEKVVETPKVETAPVEEKVVEAPKAEVKPVEVKKEAAPQSVPSPEGEKAPKKNKKIRKFTSKELDEAIEKTKKEQGGLYSRYGRELTKRKEEITSKK